MVLAPRLVLSARFWFETIALASAVACALALAFAILGFLAGTAAEGSESDHSKSDQSKSDHSRSGQSVHLVPSSIARIREGTVAKTATETRCSSQTF